MYVDDIPVGAAAHVASRLRDGNPKGNFVCDGVEHLHGVENVERPVVAADDVYPAERRRRGLGHCLASLCEKL